MTFQTIKALLNDTVQTLENAGIEDAKLNANLIASKILEIEYTKLPFYWNKPVSDDFYNQFQKLIERRLKHEPLQYILGEWSFLDLEVNVGSGALIPRQETEEVFLAAEKAIKDCSIKADFHFADIGLSVMNKWCVTFELNMGDDKMKISEGRPRRFSFLLYYNY